MNLELNVEFGIEFGMWNVELMFDLALPNRIIVGYQIIIHFSIFCLSHPPLAALSQTTITRNHGCCIYLNTLNRLIRGGGKKGIRCSALMT